MSKRLSNSGLIVAVLDHEHFRLKMLYQEKKRISAELKVLKKQEKGWDVSLAFDFREDLANLNISVCEKKCVFWDFRNSRKNTVFAPI